MSAGAVRGDKKCGMVSRRGTFRKRTARTSSVGSARVRTEREEFPIVPKESGTKICSTPLTDIALSDGAPDAAENVIDLGWLSFNWI